MQSHSSLLSAYAECNQQLEVLGCKKLVSRAVLQMCSKPSVWNSGPGLLPKSTIPFDSDMTWSYAIHTAGLARLPEHLPAWTQKEATWQGEVWTCWDMLSTFATIGEYCASQPITKLFLLRWMLLGHWIPNFACAIKRGMVSERRIVEVQWRSGVPFWMPTAHRYESMFDGCLQSWLRRLSTSAPSLDAIQATDHQKVCSKRRFPKWHPQVEAVNAGSTRSVHPTSDIKDLTYYLEFCPYIYI